MPDAIWYFADGDEERGPVTEAQIRTLIGTGNLQADDLVWREGLDDWMPAGQVPGLFGNGPGTAEAQLPSGKSRQDRQVAVADSDKQKRGGSRRRETLRLGRWRPSQPTEVFKHLAFLGQPLLLVGLLVVIGARGCESAAMRYAERMASRVDVVEARSEAQWQRELAMAELRRRDLEAIEQPSSAEQKLLRDATAELQQLEEQREADLERRRSGEWNELTNAAREARAGVVIWNYWRTSIFWVGTLVLVAGALIVGFTGTGPERWMSLALIASILFGLYSGRSF